MELFYENKESYAYSVITGVNKKIGRVIYGIEDFSFSYESFWGISDVKILVANIHDKLTVFSKIVGANYYEWYNGKI